MSADITSNHLAKRRTQLVGATALLLLSLTACPGLAQGLQPGEAFATRFSGTAPGRRWPPRDRPQRHRRQHSRPARARRGRRRASIGSTSRNAIRSPPAEIGQVFGVAFDDATPPNIYVTATAAFGLHRTADNAQWMPGMFGEGGPGAIYKLDAAERLQAELFAIDHAERASELRRRARQHRVRPLEQAVPGLRSRDRHDPPAQPRRPRPRQLRSRHAGPHQLRRCAVRPVA